ERGTEERGVLGGGGRRAEYLAEGHAPPASTSPTMALSTGTNEGSSARDASRAPTRYTRSFWRADTASTATSGGPDGWPRWSTGWTIRSRLPSSPWYFRSQTTVPITRPRYMPADLLQGPGQDQRDLQLGILSGESGEDHPARLALQTLAERRSLDIRPVDRRVLHRPRASHRGTDEDLAALETGVLLHLLLDAELEGGLHLRDHFGHFPLAQATLAALAALFSGAGSRADVSVGTVAVERLQLRRRSRLGRWRRFRGLRRRGRLGRRAAGWRRLAPRRIAAAPEKQIADPRSARREHRLPDLVPFRVHARHHQRPNLQQREQIEDGGRNRDQRERKSGDLPRRGALVHSGFGDEVARRFPRRGGGVGLAPGGAIRNAIRRLARRRAIGGSPVASWQLQLWQWPTRHLQRRALRLAEELSARMEPRQAGALFFARRVRSRRRICRDGRRLRQKSCHLRHLRGPPPIGHPLAPHERPRRRLGRAKLRGKIRGGQRAHLLSLEHCKPRGRGSRRAGQSIA